jgi:hypothetical protein
MVKKERHLSHIMQFLFFPLILVALLGLTACETAILNQPPNQSNSYPSDPGIPQSLAENFVLNSTVNVTRITIWGVYIGTGTPTPSTDNFTVIFHADSSGLPGIPISTQNNVPVISQATGGTVGGSPEYIFYLTLMTPVTLTPGTYWVEIYNDTTADTNNIFAWETGTVDPTNGISNCAFSSTVPGSGWFAPAAAPIDLAIQIMATGSTSIPTMTEWGIIVFMLLAGLGSIYYLRRQKRANN